MLDNNNIHNKSATPAVSYYLNESQFVFYFLDRKIYFARLLQLSVYVIKTNAIITMFINAATKR